MGEVTHEQINLMLRLYEMRREPRLRAAREWFIANFHAQTAEDVMKLCPPGSDANAFMRMTISYWDMVAGIVNRGLIDEELFFENGGEGWLVWDRVKPIIPAWRGMFKNPHIFAQLEEHANRLEAWREKRAPGTTEAMRQIMAQMTQAQAAPKAKSAND